MSALVFTVALIGIGFIFLGAKIFKEKKRVISLLIGVVLLISSVFLATYWLKGTSSGKMLVKNFTSEYTSGLKREILVYNPDGKVIYKQSGKFDIKYGDGRLEYVDEEGLKHNIYIGYNATVVVNELK